MKLFIETNNSEPALIDLNNHTHKTQTPKKICIQFTKKMLVLLRVRGYPNYHKKDLNPPIFQHLGFFNGFASFRFKKLSQVSQNHLIIVCNFQSTTHSVQKERTLWIQKPMKAQFQSCIQTWICSRSVDFRSSS